MLPTCVNSFTVLLQRWKSLNVMVSSDPLANFKLVYNYCVTCACVRLACSRLSVVGDERTFRKSDGYMYMFWGIINCLYFCAAIDPKKPVQMAYVPGHLYHMLFELLKVRLYYVLDCPFINFLHRVFNYLATEQDLFTVQLIYFAINFSFFF